MRPATSGPPNVSSVNAYSDHTDLAPMYATAGVSMETAYTCFIVVYLIFWAWKILPLMNQSLKLPKSWRSFLTPALYAANFAAEAIEASLETFPNTRRLLSEPERTLVANYRGWLRETFEPRVLQD
jgi:hypothetical protein